MNFHERYLESKQKYIILKNQQFGGSNDSFEICWKHHRDRLKQLLYKFFGSNLNHSIRIIKRYKNNDTMIYKKLIQLYNKNHKKQDLDSLTYYREQVAETKLNHIKNFLDTINNNKYTNILDIGCEDCFQVKSIGKYLNIDEYYCLNIENWNNSGYGLKRETCNLQIYDGLNIPYKDNTFDVIIIFQTLHHIQHVETYVNELLRILKKHGLLIIREHDSDELYFDKLIDIEHGLYGVIRDNNLNYFNNYYGNYKDESTWDEIIGINKIYDKKLSTPTNSYYAIYRK